MRVALVVLFWSLSLPMAHGGPLVTGSLAGYWSADGTADDGSGNGHHGTQIQGGYGAGRVGQAFLFDGQDDLVRVPDSPQWNFGASDFTINLWVNWASLAFDDPLIGQDTGPGSQDKWIFRGQYDGDLDFHIATAGGPGGNIAAAPFLPLLNTWYNLTVRKSGTLFETFVDGTLWGSQTNALAVPDVGVDLQFAHSEGNLYFHGALDEIYVFNRALSSAEINLLADVPASPFASLGLIVLPVLSAWRRRGGTLVFVSRASTISESGCLR